MRKAIVLAILTLTLASGTAFAESLDGRLGIYGKGGALIPVKDDFISNNNGLTSGAKVGLAAGGGLTFGLSKNFAAEVDVTHALNVELEKSGGGKATFTDIGVGVQYRIASDNHLVPYIGAGVDFIKGDFKNDSGSFNMDWTEGGHVNVGLDYFVTSEIAFTADVRGIIALSGDLNSNGSKAGEYNPANFIATFGIRLILPRSAFW